MKLQWLHHDDDNWSLLKPLCEHDLGRVCLKECLPEGMSEAPRVLAAWWKNIRRAWQTLSDFESRLWPTLQIDLATYAGPVIFTLFQLKISLCNLLGMLYVHSAACEMSLSSSIMRKRLHKKSINCLVFDLMYAIHSVHCRHVLLSQKPARPCCSCCQLEREWIQSFEKEGFTFKQPHLANP